MPEQVKTKHEPKTAKQEPAQALHEALEDSFPASDPPSQTQPIKSGAPAAKPAETGQR